MMKYIKIGLVVLTTCLLPSLAQASHGWELRLTDSKGNITLVLPAKNFEECREERERMLATIAQLTDEVWYVTCSPLVEIAL